MTRTATVATTEIEVRQADITKLDADAIVNAANTDLQLGGGVAGAIRRAGGPLIQAECNDRAPIGLGETVETGAGDMPAKWVIHAATMHLGGGTSAEIIGRATASALARADELGARSLGMVALGCGVGGFPHSEAARIMTAEIRRHLASRTARGAANLQRIVFCVFGEEARSAFEAELAKIATEGH